MKCSRRPLAGLRKVGVAVAGICMTVTPFALALKGKLGQHAHPNAGKFISTSDSCPRNANQSVKEALRSLTTDDHDESEAIERAIEFISHVDRD